MCRENNRENINCVYETTKKPLYSMSFDLFSLMIIVRNSFGNFIAHFHVVGCVAKRNVTTSLMESLECVYYDITEQAI